MANGWLGGLAGKVGLVAAGSGRERAVRRIGLGRNRSMGNLSIGSQRIRDRTPLQ